MPSLHEGSAECASEVALASARLSEDQDVLTVGEEVSTRELVYAWCRQRGITHWPSEGNFVLMRIGDPTAPVVSAMAGRGILIRDRTTAPGCAGCIRITAGIVEHTRAALSALEDILASRQS